VSSTTSAKPATNPTQHELVKTQTRVSALNILIIWLKRLSGELTKNKKRRNATKPGFQRLNQVLI